MTAVLPINNQLQGCDGMRAIQYDLDNRVASSACWRGLWLRDVRNRMLGSVSLSQMLERQVWQARRRMISKLR